jgi:ankyrin repeat protein
MDAEVNAVTYWVSQTSLHLAAFKGHREIVELLLKAGANMNAVDEWGKFRYIWRRKASLAEDIIKILSEAVTRAGLLMPEAQSPPMLR